MSLESKENKEEEKIFIEKNKIIDRDVLEYILVFYFTTESHLLQKFLDCFQTK